MFRLRLVVLALAALIAMPATAAIVTLNVTHSANSGAGSLRRAITDANALPSQDKARILIQLEETDPILLQSSLPTINRSVHVEGTGTTRAMINGLSQFAIIHVSADGSQSIVTLKHLALVNGRNGVGGCLRLHDSTGSFAVDDVHFDGCMADTAYGAGGFRGAGGAIYAIGYRMNVTASRFTYNTAVGTQPAGGAIYYRSGPGTGNLSISDTTFATNTAAGNNSSRGGAIYVSQTELEIVDSVFHDNWAVDDSYAPTSEYYAGGALHTDKSSIVLKRSEFSQNLAGNGGAIKMREGLASDVSKGLTLVNNSFVGNRAEYAATIQVHHVDTLLRNNSFFANGGDGQDFTVNFNGSYNSIRPDPPSYRFYNNLFTSKHAGTHCGLLPRTAVDSAYNLIPGSGCGLEDDPTSIVTTGVHLQGYRLDTDWPYARLGAPLRPFLDSPALDAGNPAAADDNVASACPLLDGQGNPRVADGNADGLAHCDIGAFESQREASLFADDFAQRLHGVAD